MAPRLQELLVQWNMGTAKMTPMTLSKDKLVSAIGNAKALYYEECEF